MSIYLKCRDWLRFPREPWNMKCSTLKKIKAITMMNINNEYGQVVDQQPHICPGN